MVRGLGKFGERSYPSHQLPHTSLYKQRQAAERAFSRLKGQRSLNHIRVRGLRKVTAHCYLSVIALQVVNMGKVNATLESPRMIENEIHQSELVGLGV